MYDAIVDTYPQTCAAMGSDGFSLLVRTFIEHTPSTFYAMEDYIEGFSPYLKVQSPEHVAVINAETAHGALRKQPQLPPTQLDALVDAGPEGFLSMNLKFLPTVMLISDPPQLLVCEELQVYRQELSLLEHHILGTINDTNSLGKTLEYLYQNDICTADDVLTTLQTILTDFVPKGLFQLVPGNAAATLREQAIQVRRRIQTVPSVSAKN
ncbi:MAG: hypothetical protein CMK36_02405 [Porticoccaceae bacterium]|nr:hypothetical protein [Porticoccaceae bacterium]